MSPYYAAASRQIDAAPNVLFDLVADPRNHPKIDGSNSVRSPLPGAPERLFLGARFGMGMHRKINYRMGNRVTEFLPGRIIAWTPLSGHTWRYTFTPFDGGTLVTEEWDARGVWNRWLMRLAGVGKLNQRAIERSLERLEQLALTTPR
ncbi:MAG TPA: SRPBCC family protein [Beutenbergiaceae bacterium]|nr:SRPBCC family protein [Beutenbergiaceae bacterium]